MLTASGSRKKPRRPPRRRRVGVVSRRPDPHVGRAATVRAGGGRPPAPASPGRGQARRTLPVERARRAVTTYRIGPRGLRPGLGGNLCENARPSHSYDRGRVARRLAPPAAMPPRTRSRGGRPRRPRSRCRACGAAPTPSKPCSPSAKGSPRGVGSGALSTRGEAPARPECAARARLDRGLAKPRLPCPPLSERRWR